VRATAQEFIDPPWTAFEPLRLGPVPSGQGTPDLYVRVESDVGPVLRIDVYGGYGGLEAAAQSGLVFVGHGSRVTCIEPYGRRECSEIALGNELRGFHQTKRLLLVTSNDRVFRVAPDGTLVWRSEPVGTHGVRIVGLTGDTEDEIEGESDWDDWYGDALEVRRFRLDLATGVLLE
jgi:hypothetical protein